MVYEDDNDSTVVDDGRSNFSASSSSLYLGTALRLVFVGSKRSNSHHACQMTTLGMASACGAPCLILNPLLNKLGRRGIEAKAICVSNGVDLAPLVADKALLTGNVSVPILL